MIVKEIITERKKKTKKRNVRYGGYFFPGYSFQSDGDSGDAGGDGGGESIKGDSIKTMSGILKGYSLPKSVNIQRIQPIEKTQHSLVRPSTDKTSAAIINIKKQNIKEQSNVIKDQVESFKNWACKKLSVKNPPKIELSYDTETAQKGRHTGRHIEGSDSIWVYAANRNLVDILRTVFHEIVHVRQGELGMIDHGDSYPGSPIEAMADMLAGKYIKIYGKQNPNIFQ